LRDWLEGVVKDHPSLPYFIKKRIITDNLYGVDIMEEAVEIAKLRLFLALVSSARNVNELEPLPNIDFNIMAGNSLIGLVRVDDSGFDAIGSSGDVQMSLLGSIAAQSYQKILEEKNANIDLYKKHAFLKEDNEVADQDTRLQRLRNEIDKLNRDSETKLNQLLLDEFSQKLGIKYEQAQLTGKPKKRLLTLDDIKDLKPFHWGYHFDRVMARGGFDAIIANPPWEVFKPDGKEFFQQFSDLVTKKKMDLHTFQSEQERLLKNPEVTLAWLTYQSNFPHVNLYYRLANQYKNQISIVNGKKVKVDLNLYKLFLEQCLNLLRKKGECGIVIPSSIYTDLGAKQLREMLFSETQITGLFCFENRKLIFEEVDSRFKFVILTFEKDSKTKRFPAIFMRQDVQELESFPDQESLNMSVELIHKLSPGSLSILEFNSKMEFELAGKAFRFPLLEETIVNKWSLTLGREFHMTDDRGMFDQKPGEDRLPLYEGKTIHQFTHLFTKPKYWIEEEQGRAAFLKRGELDLGQTLNYQEYRLCFRDIARNTDIRTMIAGIIPSNTFTGNTLTVSRSKLEPDQLLFIVSTLDSFICDFIIRKKVTAHCSMFYVYQLPIPRLVNGDSYFNDIVERAAKLICTTPEFDDLAAAVGLGSHTNGITDTDQRAQLRAELDGMIAHLYGLTETEFTHILSTFPIVPDATKQAALEEYRKLLPKVGDQQILDLIAQGESAQLEFKSTARWDLRENKKNPAMEEVILKTVAAFLNSEGGTLLIGIADDGTILGLQPDYKTLKKPDRDGFELWLTGDLLLKALGNDLAPHISVSFGIIDTQDICKVTIQPSPRAAYCEIKNKNGQSEECFFIRAGNQTKHLTKPSEITNYTQTRWKSAIA